MIRRILGSARRLVFNTIDNPALVLLYHRVTKLDWDPHFLAVSPQNFYEQVDYLRKYCTLLNIEEFYEILSQRKKFPRKAVIISFDDGYADNYHEALPILESLQSQAIFYITTSNIDTNLELYWDDLERIVVSKHILPPVIEIEYKNQSIRFDVSTPESRHQTYFSICRLLRFSPIPERKRVMEHLHNLTGVPLSGRPSHRLLTTSEIQAMNRSASAVIGAHTHNHPSLGVLPIELQFDEMITSREILRKITGNPVLHFSYPYGTKQDYNHDSLKVCHKLGFKMVCSNYYGQVHSWTDLLRVPRVLVRDWDRKQFAQYLAKYFRY